MDLLHAHIRRHNPDVFIHVNRSWPPGGRPQPGASTQDHLMAMDPEYSRRTSCAFLLMDDAQDSYGDGYLWNQFFKDIIDKESYYRVVVFCSYGSTSSPGESSTKGTPADLARAACMSLWPRVISKGVEANGILLDWDEFKEVAERFDKELNIHPDLSQRIFDLTVGHVGAACAILQFILNEVCSSFSILSLL